MIYAKNKVFSLEMGFTRSECKTLLVMQDKFAYDVSNDEVKFKWLDKTVALTLGDEGVRRIGSAKIPMLAVHFDFSATEKSEQEQFMKLFVTTFHKGGG